MKTEIQKREETQESSPKKKVLIGARIQVT